jgi:hypothetical protein
MNPSDFYSMVLIGIQESFFIRIFVLISFFTVFLFAVNTKSKGRF